MDYTQITDRDEAHMLATIGVGSIDDLFASIPAAQRFAGELRVPLGCSEQELLDELDGLAGRNKPVTEQVCFLGCGAYDHFIPTVVDHLAMRGEFLTAYTPYQAEASQGSLQAFYEFQTMVCQVSGMDIANASLYEAATAAAEAVFMAQSVNRRRRVVVAGACHPDLVDTLRTYTRQQDLQLDVVRPADGITTPAGVANAVGDDVIAVIFAFPNFFGLLEDMPALIEIAHDAGAEAIVAHDPIAAGLLKRPGDCGADIVVGEGQPLGIPLQYGAPYLGLFAARNKYLRRMPGRMVGVAHDDSGERGFALVLQTREQHIKRDRATSNVCTNQGLMAMRATVHMAAIGRHGLRAIARQCFDKAHYAAQAIDAVDGFRLRFAGPYFREFVVQSTKPVATVLAHCHDAGMLAGVPLDRWFPDLADCFTVAVTEKRTRAEIDDLVETLRTI